MVCCELSNQKYIFPLSDIAYAFCCFSIGCRPEPPLGCNALENAV